jgi:hypothetical protein
MGQPATTHGTGNLDPGPATLSGVVPRSFISEQSAGSLLRNALALYRSNFRPLFLTYVVPTFPVLVLQQIAEGTENVGLYVATLVLGWLVSFFAIAALTVVLSDVCLGNEPTVRRAYGKLFKGGLWLRVLLTALLQTLVVLIGFLLLIVPGIVLAIRLLLGSTVVVLEGESGVKALKRSMHLTKGHFWRLFGLLALLSVMLFGMVFVALLGIGTVLAALDAMYEVTQLDIVIAILLGAVLQGVLYPIFFITVVLLYYDLRARKESYDVEMLSEDMMR